MDTARECSWSARADASWITLSGTTGQGAATLGYSVAANDRGKQRRGSVIVSDQPVEVVQEAAPCKYEITPSSSQVVSSGGEVAIDLAATPGCSWTAASDRDWITTLTPAAGEGAGVIRATVAVNTGAARTATLTIAGRTVTVEQAAASGPQPTPQPPTPTPTPTPPPPACSTTVSPTTKTTVAAGEEVVVSVTAPGGCAWMSASAVAWITVSSAASGSGTGSVRLVVAPNTGAARVGTVMVAGQDVTITQQAAAAPAPCTYSVLPLSSSVAADSADLGVDVRSDSSCAWTAASRADWITVTAGASGTGNGTVRLHVAANTGPPRSGTVLIAGQTYTVTQAGQSCTYTIKPTSYSAGSGPEDVFVEVDAPTGCAWTAASSVSWIVVRDVQTGSGNGTVRLLVEANSGAPRTATVTIAGLTLTVTQSGPQCTDAIDPVSRSLAASGGDVTVTVTAGSGCTWASASDVPWITVMDGATGVGNGTVHLRVDPNGNAATRTGTVKIAGQTFTVQQDAATAACTYSIKPTWYDAGRGPDDFTVDVVAAPGCAWTATSPVPWATIASGAAGSGNGTVRVLVEANAGDARAATLTIAGIAFKLTQAAH